MRKSVALLLCMVYIAGSTESKVVHLSASGTDTPECGDDRSTSCLTLTRAIEASADGGDIEVQTDDLETNTSWLCREEPLVVTKAIRILGDPKRAPVRVGCPVMNTRILLITLSGPKLVFQNVNLTGVILDVEFGEVQFLSSSLHDVSLNSSTESPFMSLVVRDSQWYSRNDLADSHNMNESYGKEQVIHSSRVTVHFQNAELYDSKLNIMAEVADILIEDSLFQGWLQYMNAPQGGIECLIGDAFGGSVVRVRNTTFRDQFYNYPIQSIMNLYEASIYMRVVGEQTGNVVAHIEGCTFVNSERALTFFGPIRHVNVSDSLFKNNSAMHAGAGILYLIQGESYVTNCVFDSNAAGAFRNHVVKQFEDSFQIRGDEVRIESRCCKGVISFVGKGGAIRVQRGVVYLDGVNFTNNTARLLGGALFVDRTSNVTLTHVHFENSPDKVHSLQGDLLYSNGRVAVHQTRIFVLTAENHVDILRHSGNHWSIEVHDVSVQCPVGYRLRVTNTSAYGITPIGLRRSHKLDQLSYFCESCPRNRYSLDFGYMNYSLVYDTDMYHTLLINGDKPIQTYTGSYIYHDIICLQCPYGGKCQQGIVAVANFWGYVQNDQVRFQHCPKGYCCSSTDCNKYNTCAKNREGELCGHCSPGYSEALFSSQCIRDEYCDSTWLYPMALGSGALYALFLLFQKDIRDMMFMKTVKLKDIHTLRVNRASRKSNPQSRSLDHRLSDIYKEQPELEVLHVPEVSEHHVEVNGAVKNNNEKSREAESEEGPPAEPPVDTGASFLIILFYYFQDAQLLHIKTVFASAEDKSMSMLKEILSGLFKFRVELFQFMDKLCFLAGITATTKLLIQVLLVPYVLFQFGILYVVYRWGRRLRANRSSPRVEEKDLDVEGEPPAPTQDFSGRLATGFVLALLFTYQKLATTSFTLLNCVPIGDKSVLFIEGTVSCYEVWQYGVIAYAVSCITPFCLVLLIGPGLLKDGLISLPQFFCACIFPLPFLVYWIFIRIRLRGARPTLAEELSNESKAVVNILQGPFKDATSKTFGPICGQGVLIARRLILVVLFTFVNDKLIRMLCMMLVCFVILLHHLHVLPYKDTRGNLAGTVSAAALVLVGGINLVRAGFEAAEYVPLGPNEILMTVFEEMENVLMLWFPAAVMSLVFISLSVKLVLLCAKRLLSPSNTTSDDRHAKGEAI